METRDGVGTISARHLLRVEETPAEYVIFRPKLYVDTSIPSYLTARPSRDPQTAHWQRVTREWWELYRWQFDVYYSEYVAMEARKGNQQAANKRMEKLKPFTRYEKSSVAEEFAGRILRVARLPEKARTDATHVAVAAMQSVQYLLTWNCTHLANQHVREKIMHICDNEGYSAPLILTPEETIRLRPHEIPDR